MCETLGSISSTGESKTRQNKEITNKTILAWSFLSGKIFTTTSISLAEVYLHIPFNFVQFSKNPSISYKFS
jgi:hypothetical protein